MVGNRRKAPRKNSNKSFMPVNRSGLSAKAQEQLVGIYVELLRPYGMPPTYLHEVLQEAAKRAGWHPPTVKARLRQKTAAHGRTIQRERGQWARRMMVAVLFKDDLRRHLKAKPGSERTAQAIIAKLDKEQLVQKLPTVRTIQEDIRFLIASGFISIPQN